MTISTATSLASDVEIVRRILAHIDARSTDAGDVWREPVAHYLDSARFTQEMRLLRASPSVFAPSAAIAAPGDHVERVVFGVPLFAVRDRDGRAHVLRNSCRHRGATLVVGSGCSRALVCPYHGWTYQLDGALAHVPHADGFPDLDVATRGLVEVACNEVDGLIVIEAVEPDAALADHHAAAFSALQDGWAWRDKLLPASQLLSVASNSLAVNWKVLVEQFIEGYHIRAAHRETFFPLQYDNLNVIETFGPNSRITYPYRNIERLRDRDESTWAVGHRLTFVYQLFPNVMIATFPDRVLVVTVDPIDIDHSTLTVYSLAAADVAGSAAGAVGVRSLIDQGTIEDNAMSMAVQRGLGAGANEFLEFGRHESAIGHFHRTLDRRLAGHPISRGW